MTLTKKKGNQHNWKAPITTASVLAAFSSLGRQNRLDLPFTVSVILRACVRETCGILKWHNRLYPSLETELHDHIYCLIN